MKRILLPILISSLICFGLFAQEKEYKLLIMGSPQHLVTSAIRIDLDVPMKQTWQWLVLSPAFYYNDGDNMLEAAFLSTSIKSLLGGGLDINSKTFLSRKNHAQGAYASFGGGYRYLNIETNDYKWISYTENDLIYYQRQPAVFDLNIQSFNARAIIGLQSLLMPGLMIDVYAGLGLKLSVHDLPEGSYKKYNESAIDYGYTGTVFVGGFRVGVALN